MISRIFGCDLPVPCPLLTFLSLELPMGGGCQPGQIKAVMLLTALYGILIGYVFSVPVSTKLQVHLDELKKAS